MREVDGKREDQRSECLISRVDCRGSVGCAVVLDWLFRDVTGFEPQVWTGGIVGYGACNDTYASGRSGTWMAMGFVPRKARLSVYIMPGYADFGSILDRLGPRSKGKSCLYITRLAPVDLDVLCDLAGHWPVWPRAELDKTRPL